MKFSEADLQALLAPLAEPRNNPLEIPAEDALRWRFHANQRVEEQPDGCVIVRFRASGMRELAWHLFTWGDKAQVVAPQALKDVLAEEIEVAVRTHVRF